MPTPFAPLLPRLSDRLGMMMSPKSTIRASSNSDYGPVCAGPFKYVERMAQDRIVLERFDDYWNRDAIAFDRVIFFPIPDSTVRLSNLRSGSLDIIDRAAATDVNRIRNDKRLQFAEISVGGYTGLTINTNNGSGAKTPLGQDVRVREALELSIDRPKLVQVVSDGLYQIGNQWVSPDSPYYVHSFSVPRRDVSRAKELLHEAGVSNPSLQILVPTLPELMRAAQGIQAMTADSGFQTTIQPVDFGTALSLTAKGQFQTYLIDRAGRIDPDGNVYNFISCKSPANISHYCNPDVERELEDSRMVLEPDRRIFHFTRVAQRVLHDRPIIFLWHGKWLYGISAKLTDFTPYPDGVIRPQEVRLRGSKPPG